MPPTRRRRAIAGPSAGKARRPLWPGGSPKLPGAPPSHRGLRAAAAAVALVGGLGGLAALLPGLSVHARNAVNAWVYPVASLGAGLALLAAAWTHRGRARQAWLLLGLGVLAWGVGEVGSESYWAVGRLVPFPGWVDVFFLLAYPLIGAGLALLPRPRLGKFERTRSILDATVGVISLSLLAWLLYFNRAISIDPTAPLLENWVSAIYPIGDALLLLAVMGLAFRRIERSSGREFLALGSALVLNAIADMTYWALIAAGTYSEGTWLDGLWLLGYAALAVAGYIAMGPSRSTATGRSQPLVRLALAYGPGLALFAVVLVSESPGQRYLTVAWVALGALIVARQWVANRETREIVEGNRDAILASVAHDLRTPLSAVLGYAEILAGEWERHSPSERREMLQAIQDQSVHLSRLVTDIVDVTRGRASAVVLSRQPCSVDELLHRAVAVLPPTAAATVASETGQGLLVDADPDRIHQVMVNLLVNALRYGKPPIVIRAEGAGEYVVFQVHDAGSGVPKRYEASIWERFDRGAFRHEVTANGLGIGLAIARTLVEAHRGSIGHRRSERLGGACFEFTLPASAVGADEPSRALGLQDRPVPASVGA
jgi:signal transduction histidine kinase